MKKILFLLVAVGAAGSISAGQQRHVPSIKDPYVTLSYARAYSDAYTRLSVYMDKTPFSETPAFQELERSQQRLDLQAAQLREELFISLEANRR